MTQGTAAARGLMAAVIGMGILIVLGTGALVAVVIHRMAKPVETLSPEQPEKTIVLHEPPGTQIGAVVPTATGGLAVKLTGGGPDRIILWDTQHARTSGRLQLGQ